MRLSERVRRLEDRAPAEPEAYHVKLVQWGREPGEVLPPPWEYEVTTNHHRRRFIIEPVAAPCCVTPKEEPR